MRIRWRAVKERRRRLFRRLLKARRGGQRQFGLFRVYSLCGVRKTATISLVQREQVLQLLYVAFVVIALVA